MSREFTSLKSVAALELIGDESCDLKLELSLMGSSDDGRNFVPNFLFNRFSRSFLLSLSSSRAGKSSRRSPSCVSEPISDNVMGTPLVEPHTQNRKTTEKQRREAASDAKRKSTGENRNVDTKIEVDSDEEIRKAAPEPRRSERQKKRSGRRT